jgi:hypothetical protein
MKDLTVSAKDGKTEGAPSASIVVKVPESAKEAIEVFGDAAVLSNAVSNWVVTIQSAIRRYLKTGIKAADIQAKLGAVKMGVSLDRVADPKTAMLAKFQSMSPADQAAYIKELQAKAAGK